MNQVQLTGRWEEVNLEELASGWVYSIKSPPKRLDFALEDGASHVEKTELAIWNVE
jgi:hypothetical protein